MEKAKNADEYINQQRTLLMSNTECGTTRYNLAVALLGQKKYDEAEKELHEAIRYSPSLAEAYVQLGGIRLQSGDLDGCLEFNKLAIKSRAGFSEGYGNIGFVELQRGNIDDAIRNLQKAIVHNSNFVQAYTTLANAYLMKGLVDESIQANLKALKIEPDFAIAHNNLVIGYLENNEYAKAVEHCDKAVQSGYAVAPEILSEINDHR